MRRRMVRGDRAQPDVGRHLAVNVTVSYGDDAGDGVDAEQWREVAG